MRKLKVVTVALVGLVAGGCARVQETPLASNIVRLDFNSPSPPAQRNATLRYAAEVTLRYGYSAFRTIPIYGLAFNTYGVTVVMFHTGDPGAEGAIDAAAVLDGRSL
jgi:hypothetical protein